LASQRYLEADSVGMPCDCLNSRFPGEVGDADTRLEMGAGVGVTGVPGGDR
jgi:hypothetical protein